MNHLKSLPDLGRSLKLMRLNDELRMVSDNSFLGLSIQTALHKRPMNKDNEVGKLNVVGDEAMRLIKDILHK